ncbi:MAG TPA: hypothetical protein VG096_13195 [Bryobacteraceae bacterium]|jgi:hypothetical protein|nr:hypothetical protein [Bryobacteraceae bacterium]
MHVVHGEPVLRHDLLQIPIAAFAVAESILASRYLGTQREES